MNKRYLKYVLVLSSILSTIVIYSARRMGGEYTNLNIYAKEHKLNSDVPDSVVIQLYVSIANHASLKFKVGIRGENCVYEQSAEKYVRRYGKVISNDETNFILNLIGDMFLNGKDKRYVWKKKQKMWVEGDYPFLSLDIYKDGNKYSVTEFLSERQGDFSIKYSDDFERLRQYLMSKSREIYSLKYNNHDDFTIVVNYFNNDKLRIYLKRDKSYLMINDSFAKFYINNSISEELIGDILNIELNNKSEIIGINLLGKVIYNIKSIRIEYEYGEYQNSFEYRFIPNEGELYPYELYKLLSDINRILNFRVSKYVKNIDK